MDTLESWKIDAERSTLRFRVPHVLLGELRGDFTCWGGRVQVDRADPRRSAVRIWVELASLTTGSRPRDEEILSSELFYHLWEPGLEFDGESVTVDPWDRMTLLGWLSLRAFRKRVSVAIESPEVRVDPSGAPRFVCTARAAIDRRALGLLHPRHVREWLSDRLLGETIEIVAQVEAVLESSSSALRPQGALDALAPWLGRSSAETRVPLA
jgi:polyisoprenoid-binding protein YceI